MNTGTATDWLCVLDKLLYPSVLRIGIIYFVGVLTDFYWGYN